MEIGVDRMKSRLPSQAPWILIALVLLAATSCGLPNRARSMFGGQLPIQVTISPNANEDTPLAVELIVVYENKLIDKLLEKTARDWFTGREQFLRDYKDDIRTWKWEWIPGQEVQPLDLPYGMGAKRVVLFADYLTPGAHRATIDPQQPFRLVLGKSELLLEELQ
jgi:type VI secretion system protein